MNDPTMHWLSLLEADEDHVILPAGNTLFRQGDAGRYMYLLRSGLVEIYVDGQFEELAGSGSLLGEATLVHSVPRASTVVAARDCELIAIDGRKCGRLAETLPGFSSRLHGKPDSPGHDTHCVAEPGPREWALPGLTAHA